MTNRNLKAGDVELRALGYIAEPVLAGMLGITMKSLRNRATSGTVPPRYKLGARNVYKLAEIEAWIARRGVGRGARERAAA